MPRISLALSLCVTTLLGVLVGAQDPPPPEGPGRGRGAGAPPAAGRGRGRSFDEAAIARAKTVYEPQCAFCHGYDARGRAGGPDLARSLVVLADTGGKELAGFLRAGRPERGMPAFPNLLAQASRNGMFFLLDRVTGEKVLSTQYLPSANWSLGFRPSGEPIPNPAKEPQVGGALVSPHNGGATNWAPPAYSPQTGLMYVNTVEGYVVHYRIIGPDVVPNGYGGGVEQAVGGHGAALRAIDPLTGKERWMHKYPASEGTAPRPEAFGGLLATAGGLLFAGGSSNHVMAMDANTGKILWHSGLVQQMSNTPITYMLDDTQYVLVAAGDAIYAFSIQR